MNIYKNLLLLAVFLSSPVKADFTGPIDLNAEVECLALNIYHEARSERTAGMWAVADVTINRVKSISYPNTVCEVVYQGPVYESWKTARFPNLADELRIYNPVKGKCSSVGTVTVKAMSRQNLIVGKEHWTLHMAL